MNSSYEPLPLIIDPFIVHFLSSTIEPPPPLPSSIFFYDPFLVVPPPPAINISQISPNSSTKLVTSNRHRFTPLQLFTLHRLFIQLPYPSLEERRTIAEHLCIDIEQVRVWFSNRRSRHRGSNYQSNLIQPTSDEHSNMKELFDKLNVAI
ncbi:unnamed protein product [Rotaria socialis]|uniref:Homeobox domain-containing protein n=1 Tax=Rotaria socialis TaxID=392032 RepID=A0A819UYQ7_9BILA|nr:unnamed protein product [Rotaria socialis]CAF3426486.1 unnamed protein product [Rotaria socialis]CAF3462046.1 unnamed protein product [Rotaria socialis]CAF3677264.1 unnamed protein product [Rotaria socialis]CAF3705419.1 unnamed protein product [Rotaria socialis]